MNVSLKIKKNNYIFISIETNALGDTVHLALDIIMASVQCPRSTIFLMTDGAFWPYYMIKVKFKYNCRGMLIFTYVWPLEIHGYYLSA